MKKVQTERTLNDIKDGFYELRIGNYVFLGDIDNDVKHGYCEIRWDDGCNFKGKIYDG